MLGEERKEFTMPMPVFMTAYGVQGIMTKHIFNVRKPVVLLLFNAHRLLMSFFLPANRGGGQLNTVITTHCYTGATEVIVHLAFLLMSDVWIWGGIRGPVGWFRGD